MLRYKVVVLSYYNSAKSLVETNLHGNFFWLGEESKTLG